MEAAHEAGVIHRDLKPANIKVRDDGTVKVLDFGLAKALDATLKGDPSQSPTLTAAATQMGVIVGTAAYMSPEQARGKAVDRRSDIWAYGCVLYEMLTGHASFGGTGTPVILAAVMTGTVDFDLLPADVHPVVRKVIVRCLSRDRTRRLRDMGDVVLELQDAAEPAPPTRQDPNYAAAWAALTLAYDFKGSFMSFPELSEKAVEVGRRAVRLNPKLADAHRWLGQALLSLGRFDDAIRTMSEAVRLEPDDAGAYQSLARAHWIGQGDIDAGIADLERALAINPDLGYAHLQLGLLYALRGNYIKAERSCTIAVDMQERFLSGKEGLQIVGAYTRLGYVHYLQGRHAEAVKLYEKEIVTLTASDHALKERGLIELQVKLSAAYHRMERSEDADHHFSDAVTRFERRVARGADDPSTKYYIATLYGLRGDDARAVRYLRESIAAMPDLNRTRAAADRDFDPIRSAPAFTELLTTDAPRHRESAT